MYLCVPVGLFAYQGGFATNILLICLAISLAFVGSAVSNKILDILFLYANLLASVYIGSTCATKNYYYHVSSDDMSLIIGNLFTKITIAVTLLILLVLVIVRIVKLHHFTSNTPELRK